MTPRYQGSIRGDVDKQGEEMAPPDVVGRTETQPSGGAERGSGGVVFGLKQRKYFYFYIDANQCKVDCQAGCVCVVRR